MSDMQLLTPIARQFFSRFFQVTRYFSQFLWVRNPVRPCPVIPQWKIYLIVIISLLFIDRCSSVIASPEIRNWFLFLIPTFIVLNHEIIIHTLIHPPLGVIRYKRFEKGILDFNEINAPIRVIGSDRFCLIKKNINLTR